MLNWTLNFLILALIAGFFGFTGVYEAAIGIAQVLFFVFLGMWIISILFITFLFKKK